MLNELSKEIFLDNSKKGFWDNRLNLPIKMEESGLFTKEEVESVRKASIGQLLMLIVSEASEALEADRGRGNILDRNEFEKFNNEKDFKWGFEQYIKDSFQDEISDTIIRLLDLCGGLNIDIDWHIKHKLEYNKLREFRNGKKY